MLYFFIKVNGERDDSNTIDKISKRLSLFRNGSALADE